MTTALREILASFGVEFDDKELKKGDRTVDNMVDKLVGFGKVVAGAFAVTEIVKFGKELVTQAANLADTAQSLGIIPQHLQQLGHAAEQSGMSMEELQASLVRLQRSAAEAASGEGAVDTFKQLGVELKGADGQLKTSGALFEEVGGAIASIQNPTERAGLAYEIFGRQYSKLLPLFAEGGEGLSVLKTEAEELGFVFDDAFLTNAKEIDDNLDRLKKGLVGIAIQAFAPLLPMIRSFAEKLVVGIKALVHWIRHSKVIQTLLIGLSAKGLASFVTKIKAMAVALPALIKRLGGLKAVFMTLGRFILRTLAPFLILEDIIVFLSGGKSAIGKGLDAAFGEGTQDKVRNTIKELTDFFGMFKSNPEEVRKSFSSLPDELEEEWGGFGKALGEIGQGFVDYWLFPVDVITGGWSNAMNKLVAAGKGFLLALKIIWTEVKFGFLAIAAAISDAFDDIWNSVIESAQTALRKLGDILGAIPGMGDIKVKLEQTAKDLDASRGSADAGEQIQALRDKARLALADEGDAIGRQLTAPAGGNTTNNVTQETNVNVTVPAGTPKQVARDVGKAAADGARKGTTLRATKAALVPSAG